MIYCILLLFLTFCISTEGMFIEGKDMCFYQIGIYKSMAFDRLSLDFQENCGLGKERYFLLLFEVYPKSLLSNFHPKTHDFLRPIRNSLPRKNILDTFNSNIFFRIDSS